MRLANRTEHTNSYASRTRLTVAIVDTACDIAIPREIWVFICTTVRFNN